MIAVTARGGITKLTSRTARNAPYQTLRSRTSSEPPVPATSIGIATDGRGCSGAEGPLGGAVVSSVSRIDVSTVMAIPP